MKGRNIDKEKLAENASFVEINMSKSPIGKQDQYAASYGGINYFKFLKSGKVKSKKI